jgi:hypothetical protein
MSSFAFGKPLEICGHLAQMLQRTAVFYETENNVLLQFLKFCECIYDRKKNILCKKVQILVVKKDTAAYKKS